MVKLEIIVRGERVADVVAALERCGYPGLTMYTVEGRGTQKGLTEQFRGRTYEIPFLFKTKIEVVIRDEDCEKVVEAVSTAARTGAIGDGKIFISPIMDVVRIRTGERQEQAI
ncbi:MAG: P-II family nitrogen regulator [Candidatus Caldatribacterium sp.]|uniref:P-II family nitrogen regulator n=1 Tax=Candidatus Caldatribacterium sp. TaxID=2282143 RepID=UPI00299B9691|nr:P-II family nitrogen regulator [Candidatus Caldatribacterium sp.]MCX7730666.1 P-II family nitrogen regulator [Candidatus Caldatribacterium sp.]MDW8081740.1 P-II family nitrogen regulator [Candidatus Calescibacterium sp.]